MGRRVVRSGCVVGVLVLSLAGGAVRLAGAGGGAASITPDELKAWLSYIASDDLQGRAVFSTGIGLAAAYIEDQLKAFGAKPAGDDGSYLQAVRVLGVKATSHSSVIVEVNGESRTFADGSGITLPKNMGGKQRLTLKRVEFAGYGLDAPLARHTDYSGKDVKGAAVIWLGTTGPAGLDQGQYRRALSGRNRYATEQMGAAASIGVASGGFGAGRAAGGAPDAGGAAGGGGRGGAIPAADFTTVQRLDAPVPPNATANDAFFEFLFKNAPVKYDELKKKAASQDALPSFPLTGVTITFNIDADYQVVRTQLTYNVVAMVEGSDPRLKNSYVAFGAHYDHVGYAEGEVVTTDATPRRTGAPGRVTPGAEQDRIWNGADDDGSGTVAILALAKAFAEGPHPKRSTLFVWHVGEERGLWGSRYFADYPTVPMDQIVTQLNIDMIGRNRDDKASEANSVYLVGSDQLRAPRDQPRGERRGDEAADARLRIQRPDGPRADLLPQRSLQLRGEGCADHLLHDGLARRLPREHGRGLEDRVRENGADHAAGVRDRPARREPRSRPRARQPGAAGGEGNALMAFDHVAHIRLAIDCITEAPSLDEATARMAVILRGKADAAGVPEKYHETVTRFWMHMVARVLDKNLPKSYYSAALLASDAARTGWVDPDLQALP